MLVALVTAHIDQGFFVDAGGFELVLLLGGASLAIALTGAGRFSVDAGLGVTRRLWQRVSPETGNARDQKLVSQWRGGVESRPAVRKPPSDWATARSGAALPDPSPARETTVRRSRRRRLSRTRLPELQQPRLFHSFQSFSKIRGCEIH